jgi:ferric-dicitrate binding protein FerR (iron transport regulator)
MRYEKQNDDGRFGELFAGIPPRERPDADASRQLRQALHAEWKRIVRGRRRRRALQAIAASAVIAAIGLVTWRGLIEAPIVDVPVATVERASGGEIRWHTRTRAVLRDMATDDVVMTGRSLTTGEASRVALRWHERGSLRIDEFSQVEFSEPRAVNLVAGSVYFDSDGAPPQALTVYTPVGAILHQGTQYMAQFAGGKLQVAVREGAVSVSDGGRQHRVAAGEVVVIDAFGANPAEAISSFDPVWDWARDIAPLPALDGASVEDILRWVARESGMRVVYADAATERAAVATRISGLADIDPGEALSAMNLMTDLSFASRDGVILVEAQE